MTKWYKNETGKTVVEFEELDLTISNILQTKKILSEVVTHSSLVLNVLNIHECDSAGLQILLLFFHEVEARKAEISLPQLTPALEELCKLFGVEGMHFFDTTAGGEHV